LYVTHDQVEALAISDIVAVMSGGNIVDFGSPQRIYETPRTRFVAEFIGLANVVPVSDVAAAPSEGLLRGAAPMGPITFSNNEEAVTPEASVLVRLEDIHLSRERPADQENVWRGTVASALFLGTHFDCVVEVGSQRMRAHAQRSAKLQAGDEVWLRVPAEAALRLRDDALPAASEPEEAAGDDDSTPAAPSMLGLTT
jgi:iron(III) transport system ATP-binding protein